MAKPGSTVRSLVLGLLLVGCGAVSETAALGAAVAGRFADHHAQLGAFAAERDAARERAAGAANAVRALDAAWALYDAKILRIETGFGEPTTNDRAFIANFRERIIDQFADASPAIALAATPGEIAGDAQFGSSRAAFLAAFHDVRNQIYDLAQSLAVVLEHPTAMLAVAQSGRFETFFASETTLENQWVPVARAAGRVSDAALQAQAAADERFAAEQRRTPVDVLLAK